jgi:predicted RNA binding protein YcfA (HicA-like mRNA interferase family)
MNDLAKLLNQLSNSVERYPPPYDYPFVESELLILDLDEENPEKLKALSEWIGDQSPDFDTWETDSGFKKIAWYAPYTFHGSDCGIFITESGLLQYSRFSAEAMRRAGLQGDPLKNLANGIDLLLRHEIFHHRVESFALKLGQIHRQDFYPSYWANGYHPFAHPSPTDELIEESLATANEYFVTPIALGSGLLRSREELAALKMYLRETYSLRPPGYRLGRNFVSRNTFKAGSANLLSLLAGKEPIGSFAPPLTSLAFEFSTGFVEKHLLSGWTLVRDDKTIDQIPLAFAVKTRDIEALLRARGWTLVKGGGKGSHSKWRHPSDGSFTTVPGKVDQNGHKTLKNIAHALGFDNARAMQLSM